MGIWLVLMAVCLMLTGCGSGGYAGGGIASLSKSSITIDAGQMIEVDAAVTGNVTVSWSLSCASGCGSLSTATGSSAVYSAPAGITSAMNLTLTSQVAGTTNQKVVAITVNPDPTISGSTPSGTVGTAYSATLTAKGGTAPLKWSIASGSLPAGLTFNASTGVISGTPTTAGQSSVTLQVTDSSDVPFTVTAAETIVIAASGTPLAVTGNPPAATVGTAYTTTFLATGGTSPYTFSFTSGTLPAGLTLSTSGVLSGTPTSAGTSSFTIQALDSAGAKASGTYSVVATSTTSPLMLTVTSLPNGTVGTPYSATIGVSGGTAPYSCTITSGTLPAGLAMGGGCVVSGTPTAAGTANLTVKATDSSNPTATVSGPVSLTIAPVPLSISVLSLPPGQIGVPYSATIGVAGGTAPYNCTLTAGSLPAGLVLAGGCLVTGTPTVAGTSNLTVKATDSSSPTLSASGNVTLVIAPAALSVTTGSLPNGTVSVPYTATVGVTGGTGPYTCSVASGSLPAGLAFGAGCMVTGTPTVSGTSSLVVKATDSSSPQLTAMGPVMVTINPAPATIILSSPPPATQGTPYTGQIPVSGGAPPYSCSLVSGTLPAGLTLGSNCVITGTPTAAGPTTITVKATDGSNPVNSGTGPITVTVTATGPTLTLMSPPTATLNTPYTGTIPVTGGTGPYSCKMDAGTLPAGLTLGAGCVITGTPTVSGSSQVTVTATDSSNPSGSGTGVLTVTVTGGTTLTITSPPGATAGTPYTGTIGVTGGTGPYTCALAGGTLPAGLSLGANCVITGTPTTPGTTTVTIKGTDSSTPTPVSSTGPITIVVAPATLTISISSLPSGTVGVAYASTIGVAGGTAPYSCTITAGTLPAGLSLGANCLVSGTPTTAGVSNLTVRATDSGNPQQVATGPVSITITAAPLVIALGTLPNGMVGTPYSSTVGVSGGTSPYACSILTGTLPAGLSLGAGCVVSGTPTAAGTTTLTMQATDASTPQQVTTKQISITISPATLTLSTGTLPGGVVGTPYSATIGVTGGTSPYSCSITTGTLPAGLTLGAACAVTGTPTVAGTSNLTVKATDAGNPVQTVTGPVSITITAAPKLTITAPPAGTVGTVYTGSVGVTGGTSPYGCTTTSTMPGGLTLAANCSITGTPTAQGTFPLNVTATDASTPAVTTTTSVNLVVNPAAIVLVLGSPADATVQTPYTGVIGVSNGTAPYACVLAGGSTMPPGLTLNANCTVTGTPTVVGATTVSITATDASTPIKTTTAPVVITVDALQPLTLRGSVPNATVNLPYSQTLHAMGGLAPYTYAITAGSLPTGLTMSTSGVISGTPTVIGASSFTVTATDSETTPQTAALPLILQVVYPITPNDGEFVGPYAFLFQGYDDYILGVLSYKTATVGSFTSDGAGGLTAGEEDSNHQTSTPTTRTIQSNGFLGTYTIGSDQRGTIALTALNADGTTGATTFYSIAVKAPVSPATVVTEGSMVHSDDNTLTGFKGSGMILGQKPATYAAGLTGSYAFGLQGDTPCIPACTLGISSGPTASVGQFTTDGAGAISGGTGDENIAATNLANSSLSGTYSAADGNGRLDMVMTTTGTPVGVYPTNYAVYLVGTNQAFIMSTDPHSSFDLLAGTAQQQSQASFSNASMTGAYVGYENSATNPGLVGATLSNVLNLGTATVFREVADGAGTCNTTNVDVGGLTGLVNGLTGLGSGVPILNALLGTYQSTGNSACTVTSNGRGVLNYPVPNNVLSLLLAFLGLGGNPPDPRVFYLVAPNQGYFLETGYAGLGKFEAQIGSPFSLATLNGSYVYASDPAATVASIDSSGIFTADGAGHATTTTDLAVGVGTLNVLQLGVTGSHTYTLPVPATGRYVNGANSVIYAITPDRFVLLDTSVLTTSPSVVLLY